MLRILVERTKNGWTQTEACKTLGITKASFSNIETGKRLPSLNLALKMQSLFGISIQELLEHVACAPPSTQATMTTPQQKGA